MSTPLSRRKLLRQLTNTTLGVATTGFVLSASYVKPSLKKVFILNSAAAQTTSAGFGGGGGAP